MDLSVVLKREYVRIKVPIFGVLLNLVAESGDKSVIVPFAVVIGLRMGRCCEHFSRSQGSYRRAGKIAK